MKPWGFIRLPTAEAELQADGLRAQKELQQLLDETVNRRRSGQGLRTDLRREARLNRRLEQKLEAEVSAWQERNADLDRRSDLLSRREADVDLRVQEIAEGIAVERRRIAQEHQRIEREKSDLDRRIANFNARQARASPQVNPRQRPPGSRSDRDDPDDSRGTGRGGRGL